MSEGMSNEFTDFREKLPEGITYGMVCPSERMSERMDSAKISVKSSRGIGKWSCQITYRKKSDGIKRSTE